MASDESSKPPSLTLPARIWDHFVGPFRRGTPPPAQPATGFYTDTTVCIGDRILGKPHGATDAKATLRLLSGREHRVFTCVAIRLGDQRHAALSDNTVRFRTIEEDEIERYVQSGEPMDKAGAYAIQGLAQAFIPGIVGSYSGVMGLPLCETVDLLKRFANDSRDRAAE